MQLSGMDVGVEGTSLNVNNDIKSGLRRSWEVAGWIVLVGVLWGTDLLVKISERDQDGFGKDNFRLISEQITSAIAVLVMVLFLVQWLKLFPLNLHKWPRTVIGHTVGTILFAFGHYVLMVAMRAPWYALNGQRYIWRDPFVDNLFVEYQKDIKIYIGFVVVIAAYQYYRQSKSETAQLSNDRLVVQTGSGNSVLKVEQIDFLEAAKNYISVHAEGREYIIRETMSNMMRRLSAGPFVRTHRSFIVNVDKITEIKTTEAGQRVHLSNGQDVPLSRNYREEFSRKIGA